MSQLPIPGFPQVGLNPITVNDEIPLTQILKQTPPLTPVIDDTEEEMDLEPFIKWGVAIVILIIVILIALKFRK